MKWLKVLLIALALTTELSTPPTFPDNPFKVQEAHAIKYISGYTRRDGKRVKGHYRDTSNDGNPYNNANYLGWNN